MNQLLNKIISITNIIHRLGYLEAIYSQGGQPNIDDFDMIVDEYAKIGQYDTIRGIDSCFDIDRKGRHNENYIQFGEINGYKKSMDLVEVLTFEAFERLKHTRGVLR